MAKRPGNPEEREAGLLLAREDLDRQAAYAADGVEQSAAVAGAPDRRGRDAVDLFGPDLARGLELLDHDLDDLLDLRRGDLAVLDHSPPETREGALLVDLEQPLAIALRDEQTRRVRADVDAGTAHAC